MAKPADTQPTIDDPEFQRAVDLIDSGEVDRLKELLDRIPTLLTATAGEDETFAGGYFANPRLLWFVAENPIRNGRLPANIAEVTAAIIEASQLHGVDDLVKQANYTMSLVTSGLVARECNQQRRLCEVLIAAGANPNSGITSALAHRETAACRTLLDCGADLTLPLAAGLGMEDETNRLKKDASDELKQEGLIMAAINGQHRTTRILADSGTDLNAFNPPGMHAHSTPLHQAVYSGCLSTVCALVTRGADPTIKDKIFSGDAMGWANEAGHTHLTEFFNEASIMKIPIQCIRDGHVEDLQAWLAEHANRVNDTLGDNPRTLLHYATDWPGFLPRVAESITALIEAGADVNARYAGPATEAAETPLHWTASSDDIDAARVLIDAGADLNSTGGCIGNGTPLTLAVIFQKWRVAEALVEAGAIVSLPLVSGMGRLDLVKTFFDKEDRFVNPHPTMPHADTVTNAEEQVNGAVCLSAMAGRQEVLEFLLARGGDVNATSPVQTTALDEAINNGHEDVAEYLKAAGARRFTDLN